MTRSTFGPEDMSGLGCRWSCSENRACWHRYTNAAGMCEVHAGLRCFLCKGPSDGGCSHEHEIHGDGFRCGIPICSECVERNGAQVCEKHGGQHQDQTEVRSAIRRGAARVGIVGDSSSLADSIIEELKKEGVYGWIQPRRCPYCGERFDS